MIIEKEGGPYSLYCTKCKTWFPNTANFEMRKEGVIAHSHLCGFRSKPDMTDEEWAEEKKRRTSEPKKVLRWEPMYRCPHCGEITKRPLNMCPCCFIALKLPETEAKTND